jgi:hypothetical protein
MTRMRAFLVAIGALFVSGAMYHLLALDSGQLDDAATKVGEVPHVIGPWRGKDEANDTQAFAQAGAKAYWTRTYVHDQSKATVLAILMCGRAGKMAVHTPEVCYQGAGFELHGAPSPMPLNGANGEFWSARFDKTKGQATHLRLYWAWKATGSWEAPVSPRWHFRGEPFLYKLYVSRDLTHQQTTAHDADPAVDFLRELAPVLEKTLASRDP